MTFALLYICTKCFYIIYLLHKCNVNFQVFKHNRATGVFFALYLSCMFLVYKSVSVSPEVLSFQDGAKQHMQKTVNNIPV